jgi:hypothetical protein
MITDLIPFYNFSKKITSSCNDHSGKPSATRIAGYMITIMIVVVTLILMCIEVLAAYKAFITDNVTYSISVQSITVLGMLITQQSILFNLKKRSENNNLIKG